jgi:hypothetical protein
VVSNVYIRNMSTPFGEAAIVGALKEAALTADLARCPVPGAPGGTNWYRLKGTATNPAGSYCFSTAPPGSSRILAGAVRSAIVSDTGSGPVSSQIVLACPRAA